MWCFCCLSSSREVQEFVALVALALPPLLQVRCQWRVCKLQRLRRPHLQCEHDSACRCAARCHVCVHTGSGECVRAVVEGPYVAAAHMYQVLMKGSFVACHWRPITLTPRFMQYVCGGGGGGGGVAMAQCTYGTGFNVSMQVCVVAVFAVLHHHPLTTVLLQRLP